VRPATACTGLVPQPGRAWLKEGRDQGLAKQFDIADINPDNGEPATRKGIRPITSRVPFRTKWRRSARRTTTMRFRPDLSLITKAREDGPAYIYSLLTGFQNPPANLPKEKSSRVRTFTTIRISRI
jgi:ubiquinol-cytochrome c reductase cytochrome c1 subunit